MTRTLIEAQAFEAAMRYLKLHRDHGWTIEMVLDAADNLGQRDRNGAPVTFDPAEWTC